ncbi:sterol desaturase family protein [Roseovarius faecimaris]|uniref:Sterol desaturase family protein n=1 Tax=Roseovarius faecimaris TaxID=2494550 RepID=A0A6I6IP22_9RHOB|nr:sterol desaturase family protein [Roseovarius faecimaris]QGX97267.1 sterol desaturase family protein [Roseovarius faecimaris]
MSYLTDLLVLYTVYLTNFFDFLWDPNERIFAMYLLAAVPFAYFAYRTHKYHKAQSAGGFLSFLFPREVWSHPSAWLDLRYFLFHKCIGHFFFFVALTGCTAWAFALVTGGMNLADMATEGDAHRGSSDYLIALAYMLVFFIVMDFLGFFVHFLQHKIPILWEFHKVHHSAEVMHPVSNFREHPVDNIAYITTIGCGHGIMVGLAVLWLGYIPSMPAVFGVPVMMFLFNIFGYNLRHSHVWLRWPGVWSKILPSPAHHHVHHSCHPDHFDKNFAFMFPLWDVLFGTYTMPEDNRDVKFGVAGMKSGEMDTCVKLYVIPFKKAFRRLRKKLRGTPQRVLPPAE